MMKPSLLSCSVVVSLTICLSTFLRASATAPESNSATIVKETAINNYFTGSSDTLVVVNFWATWCAPCVKELPYFERLAQKDFGVPVRVVLVSMDFVEDVRKVNGFMKKKSITSEVVIPDVQDYNEFINGIAKDWSGALPATILYQGSKGKRTLYEREFSEAQLSTTITTFLQEQ